MNVITEGQCVVHFDEDEVIGPFFYEAPTVNGDTFLATMETVLCDMSL
jgi:hypothetical protein